MAKQRPDDNIRRLEQIKRQQEQQAIARERAKQEKKKRVKQFWSTLLFRALLYIVILAILLSAVAIVFFVNLYKTDIENTDDFVYYLNDNKKQKLSYNEVIHYGKMYLDFIPVANEFDMAFTGDTANMKFTLTSNGEYVKFVPDSIDVEINGNTLKLSAPPVYDGEHMWIPIDFFDEYMSGLLVKCNTEKREITLRRATYGAEKKEISFKHKNNIIIEPIEEVPTADSINEQK